jgi:hypothetical protein
VKGEGERRERERGPEIAFHSFYEEEEIGTGGRQRVDGGGNW